MELAKRREVQLYSDNLTDFCKDNKLYLDLLKDHVDELEKMKQLDATIKESQANEGINRLAKSSDPRNLAVMFTRTETNGDGRLFTQPARTGDYEDALDSRRYEDNPFCYLCSTLEQHKRHTMKTEKKIHGKKRIPYEAPAPFVPPKPPPTKPESKECLYRVNVKTGTDIKAACAVPVYITLRGEDGTLNRTRLTKKFGSLAFFFDSGSTEVFHIRGPRIGRLADITLAMETTEDDKAPEASTHYSTKSQEQSKKKRHHWLLESVTVKDYSLGIEYHFNIGAWLKSGRRDRVRIPPTTSAKSAANSGRGILVTTYTGRKATSGTDCRVYISLMGAAGARGRHELRRPVDSSEGGRGIFQPGNKDVFELYVEDFGELKGIRLELDTQNVRSTEKSDRKLKSETDRTSESSRTWFVDQVIVKDIKTGQKWLFTVAEWFNEETPMREFWTVKDLHDGIGTIYHQTTTYEIVTKTGTKDFAGTDSSIYLALFDKEGRRCDIELRDEDKSKFERGKTDTVIEKARVIDTPVKLKVSISGKGVAPDWYMDGITVTKYLVMEEILQYLQRLQYSNKVPDGLAQDKGKIIFEGVEAKNKQRKRQKSEERRESGNNKKRKQQKDKSRSSSRDSVDASIGAFGHIRRRSSLKNLKPSSSSGSSDEEDGSDSSDSSSSGNDSVKSHDDFDPNHGAVRLPYAVQVSFAPRSKDQAWLTKDKTVELQASDTGKMLYRQLRVCSDNENFERIRQEMLEKKRLEDEKKKKQEAKKRKRLQEQQEQRRAAARRSVNRSKSSRGRATSSDSSGSSSSSDADKKTPKKPSPKQTAAKLDKKKPGGGSTQHASSDSESSTGAFGKSKVHKKAIVGDKKSFDAKQSPRTAEDLKRSPRPLSSDKSRMDPKRGSNQSLHESDRGLSPGNKKLASDKQIGKATEPKRTGTLMDQFDKSRKGTTSLEMSREKSRLDSGRERDQEREKDQKHSPRDTARGRSSAKVDKGSEKSSLDVQRDRGHRDFDTDRSPRSPREDGANQDRLSIEKERKYRTNFARDKDNNSSNFDRLDKDQDASSSRGRSGLDRNRHLDRSDLSRGRSGLDRDNLDRSDLSRGRSGLDRDNLDRSDLSRGRSSLDRDNLDRSDLSRGRMGLNRDRDLDQRLEPRAVAASDKPRIVVTATDGRQGEPAIARSGTGRIRQRSFELS